MVSRACWLVFLLSLVESREHRLLAAFPFEGGHDPLATKSYPQARAHSDNVQGSLSNPSAASGWAVLNFGEDRAEGDGRAFYAQKKAQREAQRRAAVADALDRAADTEHDSVDDHVEEAVSKEHDENMQRAGHAKKKVATAHSDIPQEAERDRSLFTRHFLPGWSANAWALIKQVLASTIAILWFFVYLRYAYRHDRGTLKDTEVVSGLGEKLDNNSILNIPNISSPGNEADIVLMFHHPAYDKHTDSEEQLSQSGRDIMFGPTALPRRLDLQHINKLSTLTNSAVREALLQDLCEGLPMHGFDVDLFSSLCGSVLFMTISLRKTEWIHHYLMLQHKKLQMKRHVVKQLGLGPTLDYAVDSPPWIAFQPWLVRRLRDCGIIPDDDPRMLFVTDHHANTEQDSIDLAADRIRCIYTELIASFDLDSAADAGLLLGWYPVHQISWVRRLSNTWANFGLLKDLTFVQPIHYINNYLGTRLAFAFAWNGLYCKLLLALLPVALFWEFCYHMFEMRQVMSFSIIIIVWSKLAVNMWEQEEHYLMSMWHCVVEDHGIIRPAFRGVLRTSIVDSNVQQLIYPAWKYRLRMTVSFFVTFVFCAGVSLCIYFWVNITYSSASGGNITASIFLSLQIKIFEFIFNKLAQHLNDFENHKTQVADYSSYLKKLFFFQFVNNYTAFFYLAVKQRFTEAGCPPGGCLMILRRDLTITLVVLTAARIGEVLLASVKVTWTLKREAAVLQKQHDGEPPMRSFTELQSNYGSFREREQIEMMIQLLISFGYVVLFGGVAPIIVPFSFFVFAIQLRASAFFIISGAERPFPRRSLGIGAWHGIVRCLMYFGVVFAGVLLVLYGDMFRDQSVITRLSGLLCFTFLMLIVIQLVSLAMPPTSSQAHQLEERRQMVENRLMETVGAVDGAKMQDDSQTLKKAYEDQSLIDAVDQGQWNRIPTINELATP